MEHTIFNTIFYKTKDSITSIVKEINELCLKKKNIQEFEILFRSLVQETQKLNLYHESDTNTNYDVVADILRFKLYHIKLLQMWLSMKVLYIKIVEYINEYTLERLTYFSKVYFELSLSKVTY